MRNLTLTNARLTTGDGVTFDRTRIVLRRGSARAIDSRGTTLWEAVLTGWEQSGRVYRFQLLDGADATAESLGCKSCGG